eukprot:4167468-Prymnesium_polylepis.1
MAAGETEGRCGSGGYSLDSAGTGRLALLILYTAASLAWIIITFVRGPARISASRFGTASTFIQLTVRRSSSGHGPQVGV